MPPRIRFQAKRLRLCTSNAQSPICQCRWASVATTPAAPLDQPMYAVSPIIRHAPTQPPSHKPPEFRKSQLHRQYASLLRSSPLMLLFQHNNLRSVEWMGIRRELTAALRKVDAELGLKDGVGESAKLQVVQTGIFASALKIVEFHHPQQAADGMSGSRTAGQAGIEAANPDPAFTHGLSRAAYEVARNRQLRHGLEPLLSGPLMVVTFPSVSPAHLKATLSILAPSEKFPAPKRRVNPGFHEPAIQNGLQNLMLLGARVDGKVFDMEGTRWVGSIDGGLDGLRGQLVAMLQSIGAGITNTLEAAGRSLYVTVEGRRGMMEEEAKGVEAGPEEKRGENKE